MNTIHNLTSVLFLSLTASACFVGPSESETDALADEVACAATGFYMGLSTLFDLGRESETQEASIFGLCSLGEGCDPSSPLMLGVEHAIVIAPPTQNADEPPPLALASTDEGVVTAMVDSHACNYATGVLRAEKIGSATIAVLIDGETVDRFAFEVAAPSTLELGLVTLDGSQPEPLVVGGETVLAATVRDAADRALVAGDVIEWTLADDGVLTTENVGAGGLLSVTALAAGTTVVVARAGDLEAELTITVGP